MFDLVFKSVDNVRILSFRNTKNLARFLTNVFNYYRYKLPDDDFELFVSIRRKENGK